MVELFVFLLVNLLNYVPGLFICVMQVEGPPPERYDPLPVLLPNEQTLMGREREREREKERRIELILLTFHLYPKMAQFCKGHGN